jgi:pyruvate/2-oxoglutarate dehydrogenase complex dihydrolipoamide dehydrogenase (E3) component
MSSHFDAIIIGAGQAGPPLAARLSEAGQSVALIERHLIGGTCVNTGCMPTKTLVASAYAAHLTRRATDYGISIAGDIGIDMRKVMRRAQTVTHNARSGLESWISSLKNCTLIRGHARLERQLGVRVGQEALTAERIFLNVGARARIPELPGVHQVPALTNSSLLSLEELPPHLVIVGGSYVGLEFAQAYRRFGAEVTVLEMGSRLVAREDEAVSAAVQELLESEGIRVRTRAQCISFAARGDGIEVGVDCDSGDRRVVASHVLLAVGRVPNTDDLGLKEADVQADSHGYVTVDDRLQSSAPGIWALGDCNGHGGFTHTAYNDFEIVADNLLKGADRKLSDRIPCYALFTDPPLARVGLSEGQARASGRAIRVGRRPMSRVGRATEKDERFGFMEIIIDAHSDAILGGTIFGTGGDEAIHAIIDLMACGATATALARTVHIHPTVAELLPTIAAEAH